MTSLTSTVNTMHTSNCLHRATPFLSWNYLLEVWFFFPWLDFRAQESRTIGDGIKLLYIWTRDMEKVKDLIFGYGKTNLPVRALLVLSCSREPTDLLLNLLWDTQIFIPVFIQETRTQKGKQCLAKAVYTVGGHGWVECSLVCPKLNFYCCCEFFSLWSLCCISLTFSDMRTIMGHSLQHVLCFAFLWAMPN